MCRAYTLSRALIGKSINTHTSAKARVRYVHIQYTFKHNVNQIILTFRTYNHKLPIEIGRYANIERYHSICRHCTNNSVGDEYHYLFVCSHSDIVAARSLYLPHSYQTVCVNKYFHSMQHLKTEHVIDYLGSFLEYVLYCPIYSLSIYSSYVFVYIMCLVNC
jgi:hypothetical protein